MTGRTVRVTLPVGDGTRPAAMLVRTASEFEGCSIHLENEAKRVNAKSIMGMITLGLIPGEEITVTADGNNEEEAVKRISECLGVVI